MLEDRGSYVLSIVQESRQLAMYIYGSNGSLAARASRVWEEPLSADELLSSAITLSDVAVRRAGITAFELTAISIAASSHTVVCWEAVSGRPLGLWTTPADWPTMSMSERVSFLLACVPQLNSVSERSMNGLRAGGVESWLLWNLTQGHAFYLDATHDLVDLVQAAQDIPLPGSVWPGISRGPGMLGRVSPIYLGGARTPVTSIACASVAALYATGVHEAGAVFIGYREDGYLVMRLEERHLRTLSSAALAAVRPIALPQAGDVAYAFFGRFFAPQQALLWLESLFPERGREDLAEVLFTGESLVLRAFPGRTDRVILADVGVSSRPADLVAAALRSMVLSVDAALADVSNAGSLTLQLFADDFAMDESALFAFQAAVSQCSLTVSRGDAGGFGGALLGFVGADALSPVKAREIAQFTVHRERYDGGQAPAQIDELRRRWRKWSRDLL